MISKIVTLLFILISASLLADDVSVKKINFYITIDWEGVSFKHDILNMKVVERMEEFRRKFPDYPIVHFMNAAYYTHGSLSEEEVTSRLNRLVNKEIDEFGVHIHPWENFVKKLGITFRLIPTYFMGGETKPVGPSADLGGDVPLWAYPKEDVKKMLRFSKEKISEQLGIPQKKINTFRAGGWQTDEKVIESLLEEGFISESSPVPFKLVQNLYPGTVLVKNVKRLWGKITNTSAPYLKETKSGPMLMIPNNAGLADYVDSDQFMETLEKNVLNAKGEEIELVSGFHFETVIEYIDRLEQSILKMEDWAKKNNVEIVKTTFQKQRGKMLAKLTKSPCLGHLLRVLY